MSKSEKLYEEAKTVMPGGVSSPVRAFRAVKNTPLFIQRGSGAYLYDVDGREYIDYVMSFGPLIFGHSNKEIVDGLMDVLPMGTSFGAPIPNEVGLAHLMINLNPHLDWVRFVNSGTEAVMSALRLARGATGRSKVIKFNGCYHGHVDSLLVKAGSGLATFSIASSAGIPESVTKDTLVLELGDEQTLKKTFEDMGSEIAAVIIEGIPANMGLFPQTNEFLSTIQDLCRQHGSIFILDEVISGFRVSKSGAVGYYEGLKPDLLVYGKIIGGGLPVGAYGGRKDLMELVAPVGDVYQAGTLSGNPLAMKAGTVALSLLDDDTYSILEQRASLLKDEIMRLSKTFSIPVHVRQIASILWFVFQDHEPQGPRDISPEAEERYALFHRHALEEGLYMPPSAFEVCFISTAHTDKVISLTISKIESTFQKMKGSEGS